MGHPVVTLHHLAEPDSSPYNALFVVLLWLLEQCQAETRGTVQLWSGALHWSPSLKVSSHCEASVKHLKEKSFCIVTILS